MEVSLAEELLLFGYDDMTGWNNAVEYENGLAGAVLVELALAGRVAMDHGKIRVIDPTPLGELELDRALKLIAEHHGHMGFAPLFRRMSGREIRTRLLDRLTERGVLELQQQKILRVFTTRDYVVIDPTVRSDAQARLDQVILHGLEPDERTAALLSLLWDGCGYDYHVFSTLSRRELKARMAQFSENLPVSDATSHVIRAILAATNKAVALGRQPLQ